MKQDGGNLDWAIKVPTKYFLGGNFVGSLSHAMKDADLVVVTQENKPLSAFSRHDYPEDRKDWLWAWRQFAVG
ncbi:MAG: hypothetical protein U1F63_01750 [Chitinivorax sp.]